MASSLLLRHQYAGCDFDWITRQIAVGGAIYGDIQMADVARRGITHIINMNQYDDTLLAAPYDIKVLHNEVDDDFQRKPKAVFERGVDFARVALARKDNRLLVHCHAGVHRAPMMALAVLASTGWRIEDAKRHIIACRPIVDFPDVYVESVRNFLRREAARS